MFKSAICVKKKRTNGRRRTKYNKLHPNSCVVSARKLVEERVKADLRDENKRTTTQHDVTVPQTLKVILTVPFSVLFVTTVLLFLDGNSHCTK